MVHKLGSYKITVFDVQAKEQHAKQKCSIEKLESTHWAQTSIRANFWKFWILIEKNRKEYDPDLCKNVTISSFGQALLE